MDISRRFKFTGEKSGFEIAQYPVEKLVDKGLIKSTNTTNKLAQLISKMASTVTELEHMKNDVETSGNRWLRLCLILCFFIVLHGYACRPFLLYTYTDNFWWPYSKARFRTSCLINILSTEVLLRFLCRDWRVTTCLPKKSAQFCILFKQRGL